MLFNLSMNKPADIFSFPSVRFFLVHFFQVPLHKIDGGSASVGGVSNPLLSVKERTINKEGGDSAAFDDDINEQSPFTTPPAGKSSKSRKNHPSSSGIRKPSKTGSANGKKRSGIYIYISLYIRPKTL